MRTVLILSSLAAIAGCASPAPPTFSDSMDPGTPVITTNMVVALRMQVCHKEAVIGTQFPQTVCTSGTPEPSNPPVQRDVEDITRSGVSQQGILNRVNGIFSR